MLIVIVNRKNTHENIHTSVNESDFDSNYQLRSKPLTILCSVLNDKLHIRFNIHANSLKFRCCTHTCAHQTGRDNTMSFRLARLNEFSKQIAPIWIINNRIVLHFSNDKLFALIFPFSYRSTFECVYINIQIDLDDAYVCIALNASVLVQF